VKHISDIKAAVVGTGFIGVVHVEALRRLGVEVTGVVGSTPERAAAKPGLPAPYPSFEAMLADPAVDVVHLTTPNHLHYPQVRDTLAAGKHVVCEKPLAMNSEETAELLRLAEENGLVHAVNFNIRFYAQNQAARARVAGGEIGEVRLISGGYLQDCSTPTGTGAWIRRPAARSARWATSARTGSTSSPSSRAATSRPSWPT
jgi:predicted dehydrogenase